MSKETIHKDLIIIGSGPSGLTAGIYAGRSRLNTLILENEIVGGQITGTYLVENYPGFNAISGTELAQKMTDQAIKSGAVIDEYDPIVSITLTDTEKIIETSDKIYNATTVIIATGAKYKPLPVPEESKFHGKGIHYCELCDGEMYKDKHVLVVGGGNSAVEASIYLSKYASKITLIHRRDSFRAEKSIVEDALKNEKINILYNTEAISAIGDTKFEGVILKNNKSNKEYEYDVDGIFAYIGMIPKTELFKNDIELTDNGYINSDETTTTNIKGVFAAGDVRKKEFRQLTTAVSDGTIASLMAEKYILNLRRN